MEDKFIIFELPKDKNLYFLAARQEVKNKIFLEKAVDFLATFGNERYKEYYYFLMKDKNGQFYVEQRVYINEMNAAAFRNVEIFDHRTEIRNQILLFCEVKNLLNSIVKKQDVRGCLKKLEGVIGKEHTSKLKNNLGKYSQICKQAATLGICGTTSKELIKYTSLQTFRVVNNALVKEGIKGFMSIGGKKMLVEGAKAAVSQAGKQITQGTVIEVGKQGGNITSVTLGTAATKSAFSAASFVKGLGIGLVVNAVVGGIKSAINTEWENERIFICNCSDDFTFGYIRNPEKMNEKLKGNLNAQISPYSVEKGYDITSQIDSIIEFNSSFPTCDTLDDNQTTSNSIEEDYNITSQINTRIGQNSSYSTCNTLWNSQKSSNSVVKDQNISSQINSRTGYNSRYSTCNTLPNGQESPNFVVKGQNNSSQINSRTGQNSSYSTCNSHMNCQTSPNYVVKGQITPSQFDSRVEYNSSYSTCNTMWNSQKSSNSVVKYQNISSQIHSRTEQNSQYQTCNTPNSQTSLNYVAKHQNPQSQINRNTGYNSRYSTCDTLPNSQTSLNYDANRQNTQSQINNRATCNSYLSNQNTLQ